MKELIDYLDEILNGVKIIDNPPPPILRERAGRYSVKNDLGVLLFHTKVTARSPESTVDNVNSLQDEEKKDLLEEMKRIKGYLSGKILYRIDRNIGTCSRTTLKATAFVSADYPHLALMFQLNYFPPQEDRQSDIITLDLPEWPKRAVYVDPETNINIILGSDYYGELKMSALRLAMNYSRERLDSLGVHAGGKVFEIVNAKGSIERKGALLFGLSGTGKTTLTVSDHGVRSPEAVYVKQDDIMILGKDGYAAGTEMNLYPKTESVNGLNELKPAVINQQAILENVAVNQGKVDFDDVKFNSNGRAIAIRELVSNVNGTIDIPRVDFLFYITRRKDIPPAGRLVSKEQSVAYFMLGESIMTSAGTMDKNLIGKAMRVPGFDPFIIPPKWKSGKRLLEILEKCDWISSYVINTGHVGENKIPPETTKRLILAIVRGEAEWVYNEDLKYEVLKSAPGVDLGQFDPHAIFGKEYRQMMSQLRNERRNYIMQNFPELSYLADAL
ncbi:MAG: phosphoenolpyruvate carboxykinase [Conexivisphaerales archaeon]